MSLFKPRRTFDDPANSQSGFPSVGAGETGEPSFVSMDNLDTPNETRVPTKGFFSWLFPTEPESSQRGFPSPEAAGQQRPPHTMDNIPPIFGGVYQHYTPYYSRGAAAYVPNFGYVLTNPIGAGVVALHRPQASYGPASEYVNGAIWWHSQEVPTSVDFQSLTTPEELAQIIDPINLQAMVRTGG